MKISEHFDLIRDCQDRLAQAVRRFTKEHHDDCECWFELEWGMLLLAFDQKEQEEALEKLEARYKELNDGH